MYHPPNELYTAFSFIGFLFCAIPLYWHLESTLGMHSRDFRHPTPGMFDTAWNMGTCLYMIWTGLGCLVECVNSIVWNKNTTNRAPVYSDICKSPRALTLDHILVSNSGGVTPYSWASVHSHYSEVDQIPSVVWKNDPIMATNLEMFRWLLVACAFIFFAFFGFADDARQHYRLVYTSLARRLGCPTSTLRGSPHVTPAVPHMSAWNRGGISISAAPTREENRSSDSLTDETSIRTTFVASEPKPDLKDLKAERHSSLNSVILSSTEGSDESRMQSQSSLPAEIMPTVPPASVPPHFPDNLKTNFTIRPYSGIDTV